MTGLYPKEIEEKFQDTLQERYEKMKTSVQKLAPLQVGFCCWKQEGDKFVATPYTFYLFPSNRDFLVTSGAFQFLASNNYDFNKTFKDGIPFINHDMAKGILYDRKILSDKDQSFINETE